MNYATIARKIRMDCRPFLDAVDHDVNNYNLYRGIGETHRKTARPIMKRAARLDDRRSLTTGSSEQVVYNKWFEANLGHPWRNGVFCTGNYEQALNYGSLNIIMPIGKFDFLWHETIPDLYTHMTHVRAYRDGRSDRDNPNPVPMELKWIPDGINYALDSFKDGWRTDNMQSAIESEGEITLWVQEYYTMSAKVFNEVEIELAEIL